MNSIVETVNSFLEKYGIKSSGKKILLGFSGGYDSLCLLNILKELKVPVAAIHLNHNWRGEESKKDAEYCHEFCKKYNIEFYMETLPDNVAKTETAAREARYEFFKKCAEEFNSDYFFTAHNADDNAETVLYRIIKGTGLSGLSAIQEKRGIFYRPLLSVSRSEIEQYCIDNNLHPNIDSSNENIKYKRNLIRQKILPLCENINPKCKDALNSLSEIAAQENELLEEYINNKKAEIGNSTKKFLKASTAVKNRIIYEIFVKNNLDYDRGGILRIRNFIIENSESKSGKKCSITKNVFMFVNEKYFEVINRQEHLKEEISIKKEGDFEIGGYIFSIKKCSKIPAKFPDDMEYTAYAELPEVNFTLRTRRDGDIIRPLGTAGTQKLKKYLTNKKIPKHIKDEMLFLCRGNEVLWAIGTGISSTIKVETRPTHVLKLVKKEGSLC